MSSDDLQLADELRAAYQDILAEIGKVIVGQRQVLEEVLTALFAGGHCLLVGVPGLAKTLLVRTLAESLALDFSRIQFTPDLMPSDITGTEVLQEDRAMGTRLFRFVPGPIFSNMVLADEINRTPPKTQAALLESMQEHQVTASGKKHALPQPFFVLATQNPIEQEGTYPLPEAQLDRFMFQIRVDYPSEDEELQIVQRTTVETNSIVQPRLNAERIAALQRFILRVPVPDHVARYALRLARATRRELPECPEFIKQYVPWGAGPRASQFLVLGAKTRAALQGRPAAAVDDVRAVALPVLRHRLKINFSAEADQVTADDLVRRLCEQIPVVPEDPTRAAFPSLFNTRPTR